MSDKRESIAKRRWMLLRCRRKNAEQLAACYEEEASVYGREASRLANEFDFDTDEPIPDNWMSLAEKPLPDVPTNESRNTR